MLNRCVFLVAAITVMLIVTSAVAQEPCVPIERRKWEGRIVLGTTGWAGGVWFEKNECRWGGAENLNGIDVLIWDLTGYGGLPATISGRQANDTVHIPLQGFFLDESCKRLSYWGFTDHNVPYPVTIPDDARWILIAEWYGGSTTDVALETLGRQCEEAVTPTKPPKKKKKA